LLYCAPSFTYPAFSWKYSRSPVFAISPTPKAGMILAHLTKVVAPRFCLILASRDSLFGWLYMSRPSRWIGVAKICEKTGIRSCIVAIFSIGFANVSSGSDAEIIGGKLTAPKIVIASRTRKLEATDLGNFGRCIGGGAAFAHSVRAAANADGLPNIWTKRTSFQTPSGTFTVMVDRNVTDCTNSSSAFWVRCLAVVSTVFAVVYVAAYSVQMMKKGLVPKNRLGCRKEQSMFVFNACASGFCTGRAAFSTTALTSVSEQCVTSHDLGNIAYRSIAVRTGDINVADTAAAPRSPVSCPGSALPFHPLQASFGHSGASC